MAQEIREIIAQDEKRAADGKDQAALAGLQSLRNAVDFAAKKGWLSRRLPKVSSSPIQEGLNISETFVFLPYTDEEKRILKEDGAVIYSLEGETIQVQREGGRKFWYVVDAGERFLTLPSRVMEVAIYPDPERFFVPDSFNKTKAQQEELVRKDGQELRVRLGIGDLEEILPEAPEATEVLFKHLDETGVRLLGENYGYRYIRTNTPINSVGSIVAHVGSFGAGGGPDVDDWFAHGGGPDVGAARWVVKVKRT